MFHNRYIFRVLIVYITSILIEVMKLLSAFLLKIHLFNDKIEYLS